MTREHARSPSEDPRAALLRHQMPGGSLLIDHDAREVLVDDQAIMLTLREYELLRVLATHPQRVYTREALVAILGSAQRGAGMRGIDVHVRRLRMKLGPDLCGCIRTVRGVGYAFSPAATITRT